MLRNDLKVIFCGFLLLLELSRWSEPKLASLPNHWFYSYFFFGRCHMPQPICWFCPFQPRSISRSSLQKRAKKWTKFMSKVGSNQLQHWIKFCLTYKGWKNMLNYILKLFCESECREFSFCQALPFGYYTLHRVVKHLSKTMKKNKKR